MKLLILGGGGMLGHRLWQISREHVTTRVTLRGSGQAIAARLGTDAGEIIGGVDAENFDSVVRAFAAAEPDVVVNCIGIVKQRPAAKDPVQSLTVNALFPHRVAALCRACDARLVHISTDCVFSGKTGGYTEDDEADAQDLYGRSKLLGEVAGAGAITLRTSIIGHELSDGLGLVEWFMSQSQPEIPGFVHARFSGLTTSVLSRVVLDVIERHASLQGLYHVATEPISKFDLLRLLAAAMRKPVSIRPVDEPRIDRTLNGSRFLLETGWKPASWPAMIAELAAERGAYESRS